MPEFDQEALDIIGSMSKQEQIDKMTNMFTEFFMRRFMRSKVEDELKARLSDVGKTIEEINFGDEPVVPEKYETISPIDRDELIPKLENRQDYKQFLKSCDDSLENQLNFMGQNAFIQRYRPYVHKTDITKLKYPFKLEDLLLIMFGQPATISDVNLEKTNPLFEEYIPPSLLEDVKSMVLRERELRGANAPQEPAPQPVSPQEAEEAGQFITDMEKEYGPDWMWLSKNRWNWYKVAMLKHKIKRHLKFD